MWSYCSMRWGTWLHRTWKRLGYCMPSLPQSLLGRQLSGILGHKARRSKEDIPVVEQDHVREYLGRLDVLKSSGCDRMHPQVQRVLSPVITMLPTILFEQIF